MMHFESLAEMPNWIWFDSDETEELENNQTEIPLRLSNPIIRKRVKNILVEFLAINSQLPNFFKKMPEPPNEQSIDEYISSKISEAKKAGYLLKAHEEIHRNWILKFLNLGTHEDQIDAYAQKLGKIKDRSNRKVFECIIEKIESCNKPDDLEKTILLYAESLGFYEKHLGDPVNATVDILDSWIQKNENQIVSEVEAATPEKIELTLSHVWVDHPSKKIPLNYFDYGNVDGMYGFVSAPVAFVSRNIPKSLHINLEFDINTPLRKAWPSNWEEPAPKSLSISSSQWRKQADAFVYSFKIRIPVRKPESPRTKISLRLKATDDENQSEINVRKKIHWEQIEIGEKKGIMLEWPDGVNTGYVDIHPIGPQEHVNFIESRVIGGSSFAVVAPRRFGKTTLAQYLEKKANSLNLVIPTPVLCTDMGDTSGKLSYKKIWQWFNKSLMESLHSSIVFDFDSDDELPAPNGFDHVRMAAKSSGKEAIVLIMDEAQLFFPKDNGPRIGTRLKDMLELHWSRRDKDDKVPVYFGLIGLPGMLERMGVNLQGFLMPKDIRTFKETNLNSLIYTFTRKQLHTTREAREELSRKAGNLFILKTLLNELTAHVNDDKRNWADFDDVNEVIGKLKERLVNLGEPGLEGYLRDILNDAEDVNFWKPRSCYPVAVALAKAYFENYSTTNEAKKRVLEVLNKWCLNTGLDGDKRLIYTNEQIDEHLQKLVEIGVTDKRSKFQFDILEAWLSGISKVFPGDKEDREALFKGALKRIRLPEGLEKVHAGSQADVYRFPEGEVNYALRMVSIRNQKDQKRFHDTIEILQTLKKHTNLRTQGTEYIYNLRNVGIADNEGGEYDGLMGVEIYQWVDGICLKEKVGRLNTLIVADIGFKLSKALQFIHSKDIFHRDICPRNIILENKTANPVLIDFGLAKYSKYEMFTIVDSKYTAPEILNKTPKWSCAADVYSLGKTLGDLISEKNQNSAELIALLEQCMADEIEKRPCAPELVERFEKILPSVHFGEQQTKEWDKIIGICGDDYRKIWFAEVIKKFKRRFLAVSMGLHDEIFDRCAEVAQLLDFILEAFPSDENLKLSYVLNKTNEATGDKLLFKKCIKFMSRLRIERSHFDPRKSKNEILRTFGNPTDSKMIAWASESADLISQCLEIESLPSIVDNLLGK